MPLSRRACYQRPQPRRRLARWGVAVTVVISALFALPVSARMQSLPVVLVGAGDIAACDSSGDEATAALLDAIDGTVFTLGDNVYNSGTRREFAECYDPTWGRHKGRTRPAPGNHDYGTAKASGYFGYFGEAAGDPGTGYYAYDLGAWHIVVINSNCEPAGGCQAGSPQEAWLRADLAAHPVDCTLAYWHHPRFSSGPHGGTDEMRAIWQALYEQGADVVLAGHDHDYERFAPQDPDGNGDPQRGIREFVVGTGGRSHYRFGRIQPNSEARSSDTFGVLKLTLSAADYAWEFIPVDGKTFTDAGSAACSPASVADATSARALTGTRGLPTNFTLR